MGKDIHTFIDVLIDIDGNKNVLSYAEVDIGRHSDLFRILEKFEVRGLPAQISPFVENRYFTPVVDNGEEESWAGLEYVTRAEAEAWVTSGKPYYCGSAGFEKSWVSVNDWLAATWLTLDEVEQALREYIKCEHQNYGFPVLVNTILSKHDAKFGETYG